MLPQSLLLPSLLLLPIASSSPPLSTMNSDRSEQPSPLPLQGRPPLTVLNHSTLRLLRASGAPVLKMTARRWAEEQLLQARAKTEAQRRCFWLETQTEMKRKAKEAAECSVKLRRAILVGFIPPSLPRDATLWRTTQTMRRAPPKLRMPHPMS